MTSILPQLEAELRAAHERQRRGLGPVGWPARRPAWLSAGALATAVALAVALAVLVLAMSLGGNHRARPTTRPHPHLRALPGTAVVLLRHVIVDNAYAAGGNLYVARQLSAGDPTGPNQLLRIDRLTGRVLAVRRFDGQPGEPVLVDGALWVTTSSPTACWLWRLDPRSLKPVSRVSVPDGGSIAIAGGWVWVGSGGLIRVSPATGQISKTIPLPPSELTDLAADPRGTVLLVSHGVGNAYVERRDPRTGAVIDRSGVFQGVAAPRFGGFAGHYAWVSEATGMMGFMERVDLDRLGSFPPPNPLTARPTPTLAAGSNGIHAQVLAGILWVNDDAGGSKFHYCADPVSGRIRAPLPFLRGGQLLSVDSDFVYYLGASGSAVVRRPIDPRCR